MNSIERIVSDRQVEIDVAGTLFQKVVDAMDFPVLIQFPSALTDSSDASQLGGVDINVDADGQTGSDMAIMSELASSIESAIIDTARRVNSGTIDTNDGTPEELAALKVLATAIEKKDSEEGGIFTTESDTIKQALDVLLTEKSLRIEVAWVKVEVSKPQVALGNPIALKSMVCKVQAKIKACIRILKHDYCASATSPQIRLEARVCELSLSSQASKVLATPKFTDLDIVIRIKIWKWTYDIRVGITGIANRELIKQGPILVADLSPFEQKIPFSHKQLRVGAIELPAGPDNLVIRAAMEII